MEENKPLIRKKNEIIQDARSSMGELEQKVFGYACLIANNIPKGEIVPDQQLKVTFKAADYYNYYNISNSSRNYEALKETLRNLRDVTMQVKSDKGYKVFGFIDNGTVKENGECEIRINKEMVPMITGIDEHAKNYTRLAAYNWGNMKGKYTITLCQYLVARHDKEIGTKDKRNRKVRERDPRPYTLNVSLENLKLILMIEDKKTYAEYKKLNSKILKPAIEEINKYSEITVSYKGLGRPTDKIEFTICRKAIIDAKEE